MDKNLKTKVKYTPLFKLKDKPNRQFQAINLKKQFGFLPEVIVIEKVRGANNTIAVGAIYTEEHDKVMTELEEKKKALEVKEKVESKGGQDAKPSTT
jgi:hypothetical protein